ncbi:MAG: NUDIX domain-containing protein [Patescibacteria group bacterium]
MATKKKSVGIQLLAKDAGGKLVAILQVRAKWNAEKSCPESWPSMCQVTAHGKLEEGEDFLQALFRETQEELGDEIAVLVKKLHQNGKLVELTNLDTPEKQVITYGAIVDENVYKEMITREKKASFGGFRVIKINDVKKITDLKHIDRNAGVTDAKIIAMFPDEKEAVKIAFEKLG